MELQSRATVVGKALGDELNRAQTVVGSKLKAELEALASSLNATLETAESCKIEMEKNDRLAKKELEALKVTLTQVIAERDQLVKEKADAEANEKSLVPRWKNAKGFMLCINEESFYQGVRQAAFIHSIPSEDSRYDLEKDVVNGELVPLGGGADSVDHEMEDQQIEIAQPSIGLDYLRNAWIRVVGFDQFYCTSMLLFSIVLNNSIYDFVLIYMCVFLLSHVCLIISHRMSSIITINL